MRTMFPVTTTATAKTQAMSANSRKKRLGQLMEIIRGTAVSAW
jgi:hypothetical protein